MSDARIHTDHDGHTWIVMRSAEESYLEVMRRLHPDITAEHAHEEWPELLEHVRRVGPAQDRRRERWRASADFDRVCLLVEPTPTGLRVCEVTSPAHGAPASRQAAPQRPSGRVEGQRGAAHRGEGMHGPRRSRAE